MKHSRSRFSCLFLQEGSEPSLSCQLLVPAVKPGHLFGSSRFCYKIREKKKITDIHPFLSRWGGRVKTTPPSATFTWTTSSAASRTSARTRHACWRGWGGSLMGPSLVINILMVLVWSCVALNVLWLHERDKRPVISFPGKKNRVLNMWKLQLGLITDKREN